MERDEAKKELMELIGIKKEEELKESPKEINQEETRILLGKIYEQIKELFGEYIDIKEDYKTILALWIIGTYIHKEFETYPYLFLNSMRGSAKTRVLKLITSLLENGEILASLKEASLFRENNPLCIDEFESIGKKDKNELRELLNGAYKKGIKVKRMKKVKKRTIEGISEEQVVESFDVYRPIVMANIWGMDEVLGDRCITLYLEKSVDSQYIKKIEDFDQNILVQAIKSSFNLIQCSLCSVVTSKNTIKEWNNYIKHKYSTKTTLNYITTYTTQDYTKLHSLELDSFFNKIDETGIDGRHLELFFPFYLIANALNEEILSEILRISKIIVEEKKIEDVIHSKDVMVYDFISKLDYIEGDFISINELTQKFREFVSEEDDEKPWINSKWMGNALKRLSLTIQKRRMGRGIDVILNKTKSQEKIRMFK